MVNIYKRALLVPTLREMNKDLNLVSTWFRTRQGQSLLQLIFSLVPPGKFQDSTSDMAKEILLNFLKNAFLINQRIIHRY